MRRGYSEAKEELAEYRANTFCETHLRTKHTTYKLGRVNRRYRAFLRREGLEYDPAEPIKMVKS